MGRVESAIQADILSYLNGLDRGYAVNIGGSASTAKGTPDVLACYRGWFLGIEVKRPDGSYGLTEPQRIRIRQITTAGGIAGSVTSVHEVAQIIKAIDKELDNA